jgi:hypothetical protein
MTRATRRFGAVLVVLGLVGALFFWLADPRYGPASHPRSQGSMDVRYWLHLLRGSPENPVDAANSGWLGTAVGLTGSVTVLGIGGWLLTRRTV